MKKNYLTAYAMGILFSVAIQQTNFAQQCGHNSATWANVTANFPSPPAQNYSQQKSGTPRYIPLKIHYIRNTNGTFSNNVDPNILIESILQVNQMWNPINVQFYLAGDVHYIDNSAWLVCDRSQPIPYLAEKVPGMANIFVVDGWTNPNWAAGWGGPDGVEISTPILSLVSHEFGHFMSLAHTFDTGNGIENVARTGVNANCGTAGDGICDTDADPYGLTAGQYLGNVHKDSLCAMISNTTDLQGQLYTPPYLNIMSYHTGDCGRIYSTGQYDKMNAGYTTYHAAYPDYAGAGMVTSAPTNVQITIQNGIPYLTWTNVAGGLGTSIEYSTDGGTNWYVAGGVLASASSIPLYDTKPGTNYTIRIKHLNNKSNYSANIAYSPIHALPEKPYFNRQKTVDLQSIGGVKITGTSINNQSNDNQSYSLTSSGTIPEIQVGQDYPMELKIGTATNGSGGFSFFAVYLDENNDGDYTDANETKYIQNNGALQWTVNTNLNISASALGGPRLLRVRSFYQAGIQDPTKFSVFSETEDYVIFIKTTNGTAGVEEKTETIMQIHPNPTNGKIEIKFSDIKANINYSIQNIEGKTIKNGEIYNQNKFETEINGANGIYFIKLKDENGNEYNAKIIKQ